MGSLRECRIEGFICRLCSQLDRNVIHIYTNEGIEKKLEQKINVYLKINLTRFDPLPKTICLPCDMKLEQHHRFIQRVIQNQKKIEHRQPIIPRNISSYVRVLPFVTSEPDTSNDDMDEQTETEDDDDSDYSEITITRFRDSSPIISPLTISMDNLNETPENGQ